VPREQIAKIFDRVHLASLRSSRKDTPHTRTLCSMSDLIYSARPMLGSAANESRRCHERTSEGPERSEGSGRADEGGGDRAEARCAGAGDEGRACPATAGAEGEAAADAGRPRAAPEDESGADLPDRGRRPHGQPRASRPRASGHRGQAARDRAGDRIGQERLSFLAGRYRSGEVSRWRQQAAEKGCGAALRAPRCRMQGSATKAMHCASGRSGEAFGCGGRVATGSREFSNKSPEAEPPVLELSRPPFAQRTPAAESQTQRPHPFFSSLLASRGAGGRARRDPRRERSSPAGRDRPRSRHP